jgi:D,D-heptose 1,7-bisphosphate phosphatase
MKVVIIAGGQGTRIASVNSEIPKAMIPVGGKPVIEHQVELAKRYGFTELIFIVGHLGDKIVSHFGNGEKWGVSIVYYREAQPLGTAGALAEVADWLSDDFFVFYGDTVMDIDMERMRNFHASHRADATLLVHPNDHPYDSDIVGLNDDGLVTEFYHKPHPEGFISKNLVNAALFIFNKKVIGCIERGVKSHIEKHVLPACLEKGMHLFGYVSSEYVKDMGTPERYQQVCRDWESGRVHNMNCEHPRKAVFLDRDGVINEDIGLVYKPEQMKLVEGVEEAINYIHQKGYLVIVVTNQSVIARNLCTFNELDTINATMETLLGKKRAYIDGLYFCPHHPDGGYPEERKEFKMKCDCRKPEAGLLLRAAKELNIDLKESLMIGDRESDRLAGEKAGVKASVLIPTNDGGSLMAALQKLI